MTIYLLGRFVGCVVSGVRDDHEFAARQLTGEPGTVTERNPPVRIAPQNQRGRQHPAQTSAAETVEPELSQDTSQGASIGLIGDGRVVLIDIGFGDFAGIGKCRAQDPTRNPTRPKPGDHGAHLRPTRQLENAGPAHAVARGIDQHEAADAIRICQRNFRGDRAAHRMPDQHRTRNAERVEQRHHEVRVRRVGIPVCRLVGESKAAIVERNDSIPGGNGRRQLVSPAVYRSAEPVNEDDRRSVAAVDQP